MQIVVDEDFRNLIPPLSDEEKVGLEESILSDGCRDALIVWAEEGILLDGHHRKEICDRLGIEYRFTELSFQGREAAADWVDANQLGRRNLTPDQASLIRGRRYNRAKRQDGGHGDQRSGGQNVPPNISEHLAGEHGVSDRTIKRDGQFASAVDSLKSTIPDIEHRVMAGDIPSKQAVIEAAKEPEAAAERLDTHQLISQSNSNEWYTPVEYIEAARKVMGGIDIDPASNVVAQEWIKATEYHTVEDDGLAHEWRGRVWLNPPWGKFTGDFVSKLGVEIAAGRVTEAIVLVNAHATDTQWFTPLWDGLLCFTDHRINYASPMGDGTAGSTHGSVFVYFGTNRQAFIRSFSQWGTIVEKVTSDDS
jgi:hypothetical protein